MKKVYQTIVDKDNGNCMQAGVASILELPLEEVPHFLELGDNWYTIFRQIFIDHGYPDPTIMFKRNKPPTLLEIAKFDGGIDGYFYATVPSQTFEDTGHIVIVDDNLEVVHDVNPNQKALKLGPEDVQEILTVREWYIDTDGSFVEGSI